MGGFYLLCRFCFVCFVLDWGFGFDWFATFWCLLGLVALGLAVLWFDLSLCGFGVYFVDLGLDVHR